MVILKRFRFVSLVNIGCYVFVFFFLKLYFMLWIVVVVVVFEVVVWV